MSRGKGNGGDEKPAVSRDRQDRPLPWSHVTRLSGQVMDQIPARADDSDERGYAQRLQAEREARRTDKPLEE